VGKLQVQKRATAETGRAETGGPVLLRA